MDKNTTNKFFSYVSIIFILYSLVRAVLGMAYNDFERVGKAFIQGLLAVYLYCDTKNRIKSNSQ